MKIIFSKNINLADKWDFFPLPQKTQYVNVSQADYTTIAYAKHSLYNWHESLGPVCVPAWQVYCEQGVFYILHQYQVGSEHTESKSDHVVAATVLRHCRIFLEPLEDLKKQHGQHKMPASVACCPWKDI